MDVDDERPAFVWVSVFYFGSIVKEEKCATNFWISTKQHYPVIESFEK